MMGHRGLGLAALVAVAVFASGATAQAQWFYPGGYGGWHGWGGGETAFSSGARGMGMFAAGAGVYNLNTAEARSINVETNMALNEYLWESQQVANQQFWARQAQRRDQNIANRTQEFIRLRNNPEPRDIQSGNALNIILDELTDPRVYVSALKGASTQIPAPMVKSIPFQYAPRAITISLSELSRAGVPDVLRDTPALEAERVAVREVYEEIRKQIDETDKVDPASLAKARTAITALQTKANQVIPAGPQRREADNFLKALFGLTRMLEQPQMDQFLRELDDMENTSLGHLISFMQAFNLRFGAASGAAQTTAYNQLFPMLSNLRDQVNPEGSDPYAVELTPEDHAKAARAFSGMEFEHVNPSAPAPSAPAPPPAPAPGSPR